MTTIIFSDTHLTRRFEKRKFDYLKRIISQADKVIINGDFWDGYFTNFDKFIKSRWAALFPLLKAKKTIYLYGNHDRREWCNEKVTLFSEKQAATTQIKIADKIFHVEHGNRIAPALDDRFPWITVKMLRRIIAFFIFFFGKLLSTPTGKRYLRRHYAEKIKKWWEEQNKKGHILICGHSHVAELNLNSSYLNTGFIQNGYAHYLKIMDDKLELVEERYHRFQLPRLHSTTAFSRFSKRQATFTGPTPPGTGV